MVASEKITCVDKSYPTEFSGSILWSTVYFAKHSIKVLLRSTAYYFGENVLLTLIVAVNGFIKKYILINYIHWITSKGTFYFSD